MGLGYTVLDSELRTYLVSYNHEGAMWNLELKARDTADARARLSRLCFATLDGEVMARIPVPPGRLGILTGRVLGAVQSLILPARN
jgi:hypothetical protein